MKFYRQVLSRVIKRVCSPPVRKGAEIGVSRGKTSLYLLSRFLDLDLWLVDSWAEAVPGTPYHATQDAFSSSSAEKHEARYQETLRRIESVKKQAKVLRMPSVDAAKGFRDGELDFVFIDGDHSYEGCKADIAAWYPKIRRGGLLCGHDYTDEPRTPAFGVKRAVDEFIEREGLPLTEDEASIWWTIKP